jgi:peptide/nickel transport system substrate-binding protein
MHSATDVPDSWTEAPYFTSYTYNVIAEESTRLAALRTGEITAAGIPFPRVSEFQSIDSLYLNQVPQPFLMILAYNQRMNGWDELRTREVRQALSTAVNKDVITQQILRGYADTTHTFQPQWSDWYDDSNITEFGQDETYSHDQAKELLEAHTSGEYSYTEEGELVDGDGDQVELTLVYAEGSETVETTAEWVAQELDNIGIAVNLELVSFDRMIQQYIINTWQGEGDPPWSGGPFNAGPREKTASQEQWDLMYGIRFNTYPRTPAATDSFWTERGSANYFGYIPDEDHEALFRDARETSDSDARLEIFNDVFGRISRDQPVNFVAMQEDIVGYQDNVVGPEPRFGQGWNSVTWDFDEA